MTTEATEPVVAEPGDEPEGSPSEGPEGPEQERNWRILRKDRDHWRTKAEALEEAAVGGALLQAGFAPGTAEAKVLAKDIAAGNVKAESGPAPDPTLLAAYAAEEYGWQPQTLLYSRTEAIQIGGADRLDNLNQASTSDSPGSLGDEYGNKIAAARERGDFARASALQMEYERRTKGGAG